MPRTFSTSWYFAHEALGTIAADEVTAIQTMKTIRMPTAAPGGRRTSWVCISMPSATITTLAIAKGRSCAKPKASRCGFIRPIHTQSSAPQYGRRSAAMAAAANSSSIRMSLMAHPRFRVA